MKRSLTVIILIALLISVFPFTASAASPVTSSLDMAMLNQHTSGAGYDWNNSDFVFTMKGLNLSTSDDYGIKLPYGSTVVIEGNNTITAGRYGIQSFGNLTFIGSGTLTINVSDIGIRALTTEDRDNVIFRSGKIIINARTGIMSDTGKTVFSGSEIKVTSTVNSVYGANISFVGGSLELTAPVKAKGTVEIKAVNLTVSADAPAITADKGITLSEVKTEVGSALGSLQSADGYNSENAVKFVSTAKVVKHGMLFGGKLPAFVDYIVFTMIILAATAVIIVPIIIKRKKTEALIKQSKLYDKNKK